MRAGGCRARWEAGVPSRRWAGLGREARQQAVVCPSRPDAHTEVRTRGRGTADRSLGGYSSGDSARHKSSVLWLPRSQLRSGAQGRHRLAQSPPLRRTAGWLWLWLWRGPDAAASARKGRPSGTASISSMERGPFAGAPSQAPVVSFAGNLGKMQGRFGWPHFCIGCRSWLFPGSAPRFSSRSGGSVRGITGSVCSQRQKATRSPRAQALSSRSAV